MRYIIGSDHAGVHLKKVLAEHLQSKGEEAEMIGSCDPLDRVDYPDAVDAVVKQLLDQNCEGVMGILVCGSGIGVSIRANRYKGIRAALVYDAHTAASAKEHTNANILCFGERLISKEDACKYMDIFMSKSYEGGRHDIRLEKCDAPCVNQD